MASDDTFIDGICNFYIIGGRSKIRISVEVQTIPL